MAIGQAINVCSTTNSAKQWSRLDLIKWINRILKCNIGKVEELCTGAAYCNLMDLLFPGSVNLSKVKFSANQEHEYIENFKVLQMSFSAAKVNTPIPINQLVKGKFQDNFMFATWFRMLFEANMDRAPKGYDPLAARNQLDIAIGPAKMIRRNKSAIAGRTNKLPVAQPKRMLTKSVEVIFEKQRYTKS